MSLSVKTIPVIADIPPDQWNQLVTGNNPFMRHEFLAALEAHKSVGGHFGWLPRHLAVYDETERLIGAAPMYIKDNSYGEFVFDWAWADAYRRMGRRYYPKAVIATPYTPAAGPRLLALKQRRTEAVTALIQAAIEFVKSRQLSSLHWLFTDEADTRDLAAAGHALRLGCQYHWHNEGYRDFQDYLDGFTSKKRKNLLRERRKVAEAKVELRLFHGNEVTDEQWLLWQRFYESTFERKGGFPTMNEGFFRRIGQDLKDQVILVLAYSKQQTVAGSFMLRSDDTLYGRHWGCDQRFDGLHFEACYYQGLEYCIRNGLKRFEPGAQGEHKVSRGFRPTSTYSAHWIADKDFRHVIHRFVTQERRLVADYMAELSHRLPFRKTDSEFTNPKVGS